MNDERKPTDDQRTENEHSGPRPDPGTTHTTDPQKHMEGPVSSMMHSTGEAFETSETKEEADEEKERKI
jgi:hypothetical protein